MCAARRALQAHQLARVLHELGIALAKGLGDRFLGLGEVLTGIDQVGSGLNARSGADAGEDRRHAIGMVECVLAGIQALAAEQRVGKGAGAFQHVQLGLAFARLRQGRRQIGLEQLDDRRPLQIGR